MKIRSPLSHHFVLVLVALVAFIVIAIPARSLFMLNTPNPSAARIFGQATATAGTTGTTLTKFHHPQDIVFDSSGVMYVSDSANHRVLVFTDQTDTVADIVIGNGSAGTSDRQFNGPTGLAVWQGAETTALFVADRGNNRVLAYLVRTNGGAAVLSDTVADYVFGQPRFDTGASPGASLGAHTLDGPNGLAVLDTGGAEIHLFVADQQPGRVLFFRLAKTSFGGAALDTIAKTVWGQTNMTTKNTGLEPVDSMHLDFPPDVAVSPRGDRLYIADRFGRVVVEQLTESDTFFDGVYLQGDLVTQNVVDPPRFVAISDNGLTIAIGTARSSNPDDNGSLVILYKDTAGTFGAAELQRIGTTAFNSNGIIVVVSNSINMAVGGGGFIREPNQLWVASGSENRVLRFDATAFGQSDSVPTSSIVDPVDTAAIVSAPADTGTDSYVQVNLNGGALTTGTLASAVTASGAGAGYTCTTTLVNAADTLACHIWTNQINPAILIGLRRDTAAFSGTLPSGITNDDTGRRALGATAVFLEFLNGAGQLLGDTNVTTPLGDTFAYTVVYTLSRATVAYYRSLGLDTSPGSKDFGFYFADTIGATWTRDTMVSITVETGPVAGGLVIRVAGITRDLPGGLGGVAGSTNGASGGGACLIVRAAPPSWFLAFARACRDYLLGFWPGRILTDAYYSLMS